ncbi:putative signal peptide protein [Puccinia sorghi]|uniref:Putative signal peptide protein n=1 Tax=Puccinia sorghi TaxID=27349 RepID=A0A0L6UXA6_9BASI|nr:putative signal peptide protein [Puccinia sorghi]
MAFLTCYLVLFSRFLKLVPSHQPLLRAEI